MKIPSGAVYLSRRTFIARSSAVLAGAVLFGTRVLGQAPALWRSDMQLDVRFRLLSPPYRSANPYIAVWIEHPDGRPVRTLGLWADMRRGAQYVYRLSRWNRWPRFPDRSQDHPATLDLARAISRPTCAAGSYSLVWDGRDDLGQAVPLGTYVLCIEAAREKSDYALVRGEIVLDGGSCDEILTGASLIGDVDVSYRPSA